MCARGRGAGRGDPNADFVPEGPRSAATTAAGRPSTTQAQSRRRLHPSSPREALCFEQAWEEGGEKESPPLPPPAPLPPPSPLREPPSLPQPPPSGLTPPQPRQAARARAGAQSFQLFLARPLLQEPPVEGKPPPLLQELLGGAGRGSDRLKPRCQGSVPGGPPARDTEPGPRLLNSWPLLLGLSS